jgi:hypothetical protein
MYAGVETSIMILWKKGLASGLEFGLASLLLIHSTDIILIGHDSVHKNSGMTDVVTPRHPPTRNSQNVLIQTPKGGHVNARLAAPSSSAQSYSCAID